MHENRFNEYRIPSGMLIVFLEKALTLIHMETHLDDVSDAFEPINQSVQPLVAVYLASVLTTSCNESDAILYLERFLN